MCVYLQDGKDYIPLTAVEVKGGSLSPEPRNPFTRIIREETHVPQIHCDNTPAISLGSATCTLTQINTKHHIDPSQFKPQYSGLPLCSLYGHLLVVSVTCDA